MATKRATKKAGKKDAAAGAPGQQSLSSVVSAINSRYGTSTIRRFTDQVSLNLVTVPTGSMELDATLGGGGYPRGKIVEAFGPPGGGKSTLLWHAIAEQQRNGGRAGLVENEHKIDPEYARACGVNLDDLYLSQPSSAEESCSVIELLVASREFHFVGLDSIGGLVMSSEIDQDDDSVYVPTDYSKRSDAGFARAYMLRRWLRKVAPTCDRTGTSLMLINHVYSSPDKGEQTAGGDGPKYHSMVRMKVRQWWEKKATGNRHAGISVTVVKNQAGGRPYASVNLPFAPEHNTGLDYHASVLRYAAEIGVVQKNGAWYSWTPAGASEDDLIKLGQGWATATTTLQEHPDMLQQILIEVDGKMGWRRS